MAGIIKKLTAVLELPLLGEKYPYPKSRNYQSALRMILPSDENPLLLWGPLFAWLFTHDLGAAVTEKEIPAHSSSLLDEWLLHKIITRTLNDLGLSKDETRFAVQGLKVWIGQQDWHTDKTPKKGRAQRILETWLADPHTQQLINVNRYDEILWFNKEAFEALLRGMLVIATIATLSNPQIEAARVPIEILDHYAVIKKLQKAANASKYQVEELLNAAQ